MRPLWFYGILNRKEPSRTEPTNDAEYKMLQRENGRMTGEINRLNFTLREEIGARKESEALAEHRLRMYEEERNAHNKTREKYETVLKELIDLRENLLNREAVV